MKDARSGRCNQYHNNLILKYSHSFFSRFNLIPSHPRINAKLGGVNYVPLNAAMMNFKKTRTMVLGKDNESRCDL